MNVELTDLLRDETWYFTLDILPRVGEGIVIASAPKGVFHRVDDVQHHVGAAGHRVVIFVRRLNEI